MNHRRPHGRHRLLHLLRLGVASALATTLVVGSGVALSHAHQPAAPASTARLGDAADRVSQEIAAAPRPEADRSVAVSRSMDRAQLATPVAHGKRWTTARLDVRVRPREHGRTLGEIAQGKQVPVTGLRSHGFAQVVLAGSARWVNASYLSAKKQVEPGSKGLVDRPCPGTSGVESGLTSGAVRVYRAVCNNFPQITQYGGYAPRGEHASGKAIDVMTSETRLGGEIAAFLQRNAAALDLYDIIWRQHIWTPVRASEGWRSMPDRGSETANHYDHVHVSVN